MTSALYGRMRFGRCVKTNFGFMGCFTDVLDLLDRRCSGRRSCSVEVVEPTFDGVRPCNKELKCYLEVDYRCIRSTCVFELWKYFYSPQNGRDIKKQDTCSNEHGVCPMPL